MILQSEFAPEVPIFLDVVSEETSATLDLQASHCVHSYEFSIRNEGDDSGGEYRTIDSSEMTVNIQQPGLKPCTKYEASIQAHLEGSHEGSTISKYSDEVSKSFSTKPTINTSDNITLDEPVYGVDYISFSLVAPWSPGLNCLKQYRIEVCPNEFFGTDSTCTNPTSSTTNEITANNPTLETRIENLTPCTIYHLMITPIFDNIEINIQMEIYTSIYMSS